MNNTELVLQLLILAVSKAESLATLYRQARTEGRDVTDDELKTLSGGADASAQALQNWIDGKP